MGSFGEAFSCGARKHFFDDLGKTFSPVETVLQKVIQPYTRVVFLAENHLDAETNIRFPQILVDIKKSNPALDCLFLEFPRHYQELFEDYFYDRKNFDESIGRMFITDKWDVIPGLVKSRTPLFETAKQLGLRILPVDLNDSERGNIPVDLTNPDYLNLIIRRNKAMASRIRGASECHMAIMPIGAAHLSFYIPHRDNVPSGQFESLTLFPSDTLPLMLQKKGVPTVSIFPTAVQHVYESDSTIWNRSDCDGSSSLNLPTSEGGFLIHKAITPLVPTEVGIPTEVWNDFDALLFLK